MIIRKATWPKSVIIGYEKSDAAHIGDYSDANRFYSLIFFMSLSLLGMCLQEVWFQEKSSRGDQLHHLECIPLPFTRRCVTGELTSFVYLNALFIREHKTRIYWQLLQWSWFQTEVPLLQAMKENHNFFLFYWDIDHTLRICIPAL